MCPQWKGREGRRAGCSEGTAGLRGVHFTPKVRHLHGEAIISMHVTSCDSCGDNTLFSWRPTHISLIFCAQQPECASRVDYQIKVSKMGHMGDFNVIAVSQFAGSRSRVLKLFCKPPPEQASSPTQQRCTHCTRSGDPPSDSQEVSTSC